jgi:hypothetical protein
MGNQCAQTCCHESRGTEAQYDLDSEHVPSYSAYKKEQYLSDYPRIGLKPQQDHVDQGIKQEDADESNQIQLGVTAPAHEDIHGQSMTGALARQEELLSAQQQELQFLQQQAAQQQELLLLRQQLAAATLAQQEQIVQPVNQNPTEAAVPPAEKGKGKGKGKQFQKDVPTGETAVPEDVPCLEMVFEVDGQDNTVRLFRRPLGADFAKKGKALTKIDRVKRKSYASELGLKKGWIVKSVAQADVTKMTFEEAQDAILKGLLTLPTQTSS